MFYDLLTKVQKDKLNNIYLTILLIITLLIELMDFHKNELVKSKKN